jgi:CDP-glucose 4,6-dehydratase
VASARAGNVIGGGDWAKDRIVPDCIRALSKGEPIPVRNKVSTRPWQHVLEPLSGYLLLASKMLQEPTRYCEGWNFGPRTESITPVWDVATLLTKYYGKGELIDVSDPNALHEANLLMLDISKAKFLLGWEPRTSIEQCCQLTADWYKHYQQENVYNLCVEQIMSFIG